MPSIPLLTDWLTTDEDTSPTVTFHLFGQVSYPAIANLQKRLTEEALVRGDTRIAVLLFEHAPCITVGSRGSRRHIRFTAEEMKKLSLETHWVNRSGGCWMHAPGQLGIYVVAPLTYLRWTPAELESRLCVSLQKTLMELGFHTKLEEKSGTLLGRTGILSTVGFGVRDGISNHGAVLNVNPAMANFEFIDVAAEQSMPAGMKPTMSCLLAEHRQPLKMTLIRTEVMQHLAESFGTERYHISTGHPFLPRSSSITRVRLEVD